MSRTQRAEGRRIWGIGYTAERRFSSIAPLKRGSIANPGRGVITEKPFFLFTMSRYISSSDIRCHFPPRKTCELVANASALEISAFREYPGVWVGSHFRTWWREDPEGCSLFTVAGASIRDTGSNREAGAWKGWLAVDWIILRSPTTAASRQTKPVPGANCLPRGATYRRSLNLNLQT